MTQIKHTPGPWKFEAETKTIRSIPANYWLASVDSWDGAVNHEANARLIASAPEMLEALEYAYKFVTIARKYFPRSIKHGDRLNLEIACATIGNAIHKAKGESCS